MPVHSFVSLMDEAPLLDRSPDGGPIVLTILIAGENPVVRGVAVLLDEGPLPAVSINAQGGAISFSLQMYGSNPQVMGVSSLLDEGPIALPGGESISIDGGPIVFSLAVAGGFPIIFTLRPGGGFELEAQGGPIIFGSSMGGKTQIDNMVYVPQAIQFGMQVRGQMGPPTSFAASPITMRLRVGGLFMTTPSVVVSASAIVFSTALDGGITGANSQGGAISMPLIVRGRFQTKPSTGIPEYRIELRDRDGVLQYEVSKTAVGLSWDFSRTGGCRSASFQIVDPPLTMNENDMHHWDVRILLDVGSGAVPWWRGYIINPRLVMGSPYMMDISAVGWSQRLERLPVVGLGFPSEDGGVLFENMDAAAIARQLIDRSNAAGAGFSYTYGMAPDSGFVLDSIQFNSSIFTALSTLAELSGRATWGVNAYKEFFFLPNSEKLGKTFLVEKDIEEMNHISDSSRILNRIYLLPLERAIEETDTLTTDQSQAVDNATIAFGKATSNQKIIQIFTTTATSLSAITMKLSKTGWGANLIVDGDMELNDGSNPAKWKKIWDRSKRRKSAADPFAGVRCLEVYHNQTGKGKYGVYQDVPVTPGQPVQLSGQLRDPAKEDLVMVELLDGQTGAKPVKDSDPVIASIQGVSRNTAWHRLSVGTTPESSLVGIRIWSKNRIGGTGGDSFFIDNVSLSDASDVVISVVERIGTSPDYFDEDNPLASASVPFEEITGSPAAFTVGIVASPLDPNKTYGIMVSSGGELSDSQYFLLSYNTAGSGLRKNDGAGWSTVTGSAFFSTSLPSSQLDFGVFSEVMFQPHLDNDADALLWGKAILANQSSPIEKGYVKLKPNRNLMIEDTAPVELVRIRTGREADRVIDFTLRPEVISYAITADGLATSIDLGGVLPRIASILNFLEYKIALRGER